MVNDADDYIITKEHVKTLLKGDTNSIQKKIADN